MIQTHEHQRGTWHLAMLLAQDKTLTEFVPEPPDPNYCKQCGEPLGDTRDSGQTKVFCSPRCKQRHNYVKMMMKKISTKRPLCL